MTPLMKQYWSVKSSHPDKIVLFRMGDFFEMFHDDAKTAAPLMGIALTARNKKSGDETPMCGVPHHSIAGQINKLLSAGKKVAICDQVEDPKTAKGLVKREITRILSPGMVYDPETLEAQAPNYICSFDKKSVSFMDSTTGECFYFLLDETSQISPFIETLSPVEIILSEKQEDDFHKLKPSNWNGLVSFHEEVSESEGEIPESALRLLSYAVFMQGPSVLDSLHPFEKRSSRLRMEVSSQVFRHLEIFKTYKGDRENTLFDAINRTKTAGGARKLRNWLQFPLLDREEIEFRQNQVEEWTKRYEDLKMVRKTLYSVGDLERRIGKISQPQCHPRDLTSLCDSMDSALELLPFYHNFAEKKEAVEQLKSLRDTLSQAFVDELPVNFRDGGFIATGFNSKLDDLIHIAQDSQTEVRQLEADEKEKTGIPSLKVRYNNVFGFYIEIRNTHKSKVPKDRYQRKQTLTNAERYVTDELNELEKRVITAKSKRADLEIEILNDLKKQITDSMRNLVELASESNTLDVYTALAYLAVENNYCRPELKKQGEIEIEGSRHPVIEQVLSTQFIPNDINLGSNQCLLLTGPNMAGKSTLMRQVAITSLLAQVGSFVPARKACLPIVDKIFTRIGASDFLTEGLSTFMVEMTETAEMLKKATENSLVILDEVGRGTSTYDGMSLAQSILEYFVNTLKSYTLFATHYHELTDLDKKYPDRLLNRHMTISEEKGQLIFRYQLKEGPAQKSYGIQVAKLAGLPASVVKYADKLLKEYEKNHDQQVQGSSQLDLWQSVLEQKEEEETTAIDPEVQKWLTAIRELEIQSLTPLDALNRLAKWQQELS